MRGEGVRGEVCEGGGCQRQVGSSIPSANTKLHVAMTTCIHYLKVWDMWRGL